MADELDVGAMEPVDAVLDFIERINSRDPQVIVDAITDDHEFTDSAGGTVRGRSAMLKAWTAYFCLFPDYQVHVDRILPRDDRVIVVGHSTGTLSPEGRAELSEPDGRLPSEEQLQGPAIWVGRVLGGKLASWQVLADSAEVRGSLGIP